MTNSNFIKATGPCSHLLWINILQAIYCWYFKISLELNFLKSYVSFPSISDASIAARLLFRIYKDFVSYKVSVNNAFV